MYVCVRVRARARALQTDMLNGIVTVSAYNCVTFSVFDTIYSCTVCGNQQGYNNDKNVSRVFVDMLLLLITNIDVCYLRICMSL